MTVQQDKCYDYFVMDQIFFNINPTLKQLVDNAQKSNDLLQKETVYHCYSEALKAKLEKIFSEPLSLIVPLKNDLSVLSHARIEIQPSTEEFFENIVFFLGKHGLYGKVVE